MKKLITILTTTSFSLVPTINIIACQNDKAKAEEEIVGETIVQAILDSAMEEMKQEQKDDDTGTYVKKRIEDENLQKIVTNYKEYPEFIPMMEILNLSLSFMENHNFDKSSNIYNLHLVLPQKYITLDDLLKENLTKFKVIPVTEKWFVDVKTVNDSDNPKPYEFKLKFGKTLSTKTIAIKMFWENEQN